MKTDWPRRVCVLGSALLAVAAVCGEGFRLAPEAATAASLLLLLVVVLTAAAGRLLEAVVVSIIAALGLDYFFIRPVGSISVADGEGWFALLLFLVTGLVASNISYRFRRQREQLLQRTNETERIHALSRWILAGANAEEVLRSALNKCIEIFHFERMSVYDAAAGKVYHSDANAPFSEELLRRTAVSGTDHYGESGVVVLPITFGNARLGSMAACGTQTPETVMRAICNTLALGLAQAQAQVAAGQAEAVRRSEELKSVMIDALAHDLKSPLTSIEASAELLSGTSLTPAQRSELTQVISEESRALRRLIEEAIHLARIDADRMHLEYAPMAVEALVQQSLKSLGERTVGRPIHLQLPGEFPVIRVDADLMSQAIKQLLDNAFKYSGAQNPVWVHAVHTGGEVIISVRDQGPGLTELEQTRVFDKFYRGRYDRSAVQGTGMGLAIAKEIVEAHGGRLRVNSRVGEGSEFTITLPVQTSAILAGAL